MRGGRRLIALGGVLLVVSLCGCPLTASDDYELVGNGGAGASGGSQAGGAGGLGGAGGSSGGSGGDGTGVCCVDLSVDCTDHSCFDDTGLVVRYFIDEASTGQDVPQLDDAAPNPMALGIVYSSEMSFDEVAGHRGLRWDTTGADGRASVPVDGTKVAAALDGQTFATIELVLALEDVDNLNSRIFYVGTGIEPGRFALMSDDTSVLRFSLNNNPVHSWMYDASSGTRRVVHLVLDTMESNQTDRVKLFVDGVPAMTNATNPPAANETIDLMSGRTFVLGNRDIGGRSPQGMIHYAALYARPLSAEDVALHAAILSRADDR